MNTTIANQRVLTDTVTKKQKAETLTWKKAEEARFGILPLILLAVTCLSGIAMAFGTGNEVFQMITVTVPAMATLSFILAVAPMPLIIWSAVIAILADLLVFII